MNNFDPGWLYKVNHDFWLQWFGSVWPKTMDAYTLISTTICVLIFLFFIFTPVIVFIRKALK